LDDIDDIIKDEQEEMNRSKGFSTPKNQEIETTYFGNEEENVKEKPLIGRVEKYFSKINVVAILLEKDLKIGDLIEIGDGEESVQAIVSSMQIERVDVQEASEGDSVGIRVDEPVKEGSKVYLVSRAED
jgi:hypothetical protein